MKPERPDFGSDMADFGSDMADFGSGRADTVESGSKGFQGTKEFYLL